MCSRWAYLLNANSPVADVENRAVVGVRHSVPVFVVGRALLVDGWISTDDEAMAGAVVPRDGRDGRGQADENQN